MIYDNIYIIYIYNLIYIYIAIVILETHRSKW